MVTILDCINRIPTIVKQTIIDYSSIYDSLELYLQDKEINEIIFIGSGTSNTTTHTAARFVENAAHITVNHYLPNVFLNKTCFNDKALYVFVSQSGTSTLTNKALQKVKQKGYYNACICADPDSKMVSMSDCFIDLSCGYEEYGMRTIGYVSTVLIEMLLGVRIGRIRSAIDENEEKMYLADAEKCIDGIIEMTVCAQSWYQENRNALLNAESIILYGGKGLWGVALEGALKILEIARSTVSIGYEIDDGCHGPTMGFTSKTAVIALNVDDENQKTAVSLTDFAKNELGFGALVGNNANSKEDLSFANHSKYFYCLEFAPFVQVLAYLMAVDRNIDLKPSKIMSPLPEKKYFNMHEE